MAVRHFMCTKLVWLFYSRAGIDAREFVLDLWLLDLQL